jgi:hypothetical protein
MRWLAAATLIFAFVAWSACGDSVAGEDGEGGFAATDTASNGDSGIPVLGVDRAPGSAITYYGHAKALIEQHCVRCHTPGESGQPYLTSYQMVAGAKDAIVTALESGHMPPGQFDPLCEAYVPDRTFSDEALGTLLAWISDGVPEGYPADYVAPFLAPATSLPGTTVMLEMSEPYNPIGGQEDYRCIPLAWSGSVPLYITGTHIMPGARSQIPQVIAYIAPPQLGAKLTQVDKAHPGGGYPCLGSPLPSDGSMTGEQAPAWLDVWHPGDAGKLFPTATGVRIDPGSTVILQVHYSAPAGANLTDLSAIELQVASTVQQPAAVIPFTNNAWSFAGAGSLFIGMGLPEVMLGHSGDLFQFANFIGANLDMIDGQPLFIYGAGVQMNRLGTRGRVALRRSNGAEDCLLDAPAWSFEWRQRHHFTTPKIINVGDQVEVVCTWDNSQANQPWSNGMQAAPQEVVWGDGPQDEQCVAMLLVSAMSSTPGQCIPACGAKQCGSDGCGGVCGDCPPDTPNCLESTGQCTNQCIADCALKQCGDDGCGGSCGECPATAPNCDPSNHLCTALCIPTCGDVECGSNGCGGSCGVCDSNAPYCIEGLCYADAEGTCLPACDDKQCGANGCGGNCGVCPPTAPTCIDGVCGGTCQANCSGKQCGDDGCGGSCGECPDWAPNCVQNFCADSCVPDCIGKVCGDDGCGGVCGFCSATAACVSGQCILGCDNPCEGKQCGEDGCGGSCGACGGNFVCQNGICTDGSGCTPNCFGKQCGNDGCGGSCGACTGTLQCQNGVCMDTSCSPNCQNIQCGPDGCGGSCGTCLGNSWCQGGVCTGGACTPSCNGKQCGDDGCGGSCGNCPAGTTCNIASQCQSTGTTGGTGACTNATDQAILNQIDAQTMATECGLGCIGDLNASACATTCLQAQSDLSAGCAGCFGKLVGCIIDNCLTNCINPEDPECTSCTANFCGSAFQSCSGIPLGT